MRCTAAPHAIPRIGRCEGHELPTRDVVRRPSAGDEPQRRRGPAVAVPSSLRSRGPLAMDWSIRMGVAPRSRRRRTQPDVQDPGESRPVEPRKPPLLRRPMRTTGSRRYPRIVEPWIRTSCSFSSSRIDASCGVMLSPRAGESRTFLP
jgi:hypothetical protein